MEANPGSLEHLTLGSIAVRLLIVIVLVMANAFFVASEFALVAARRSKIEAAAERGDKSARLVRDTIMHLDRYISATQLGITIASLALGWMGERALAELVDRMLVGLGAEPNPVLVHSAAAVTVAFLIITYLHVVIGELAPKSLALLKPEGVSAWVARPLRAFSVVMTPFIWLLNGSANLMLRAFGLSTVQEAGRVHSPEELRLLVMQSRAGGQLDEFESEVFAGVFDFHHKRARDVMLPRTEIVALQIDASAEEVWEVLRRERYSRYPVYRDSLDDVGGVFLAKDFWLYEGNEPFSLARFLRDALFVPDTRRAELVFSDLQKTRAHMAIVLDEYGGTAGIITMEDLVEEVVGDIADEYDAAVREAMEMDGMLELAGNLSLIDVRSDYHVNIPEGDWSTLGGYVFARLGRLPKVGDRTTYAGGELEVVAMDGRRVAAVRVHRRPVTGRAAS